MEQSPIALHAALATLSSREADRVSKIGTKWACSFFTENALARGLFAMLSQIGTKTTRESKKF
jgi:hypothetical protein